MENHVFLPVQIAVSLRGLGSFVFQRDGFAWIVLNISFFDATEEGGTFSFYRKIYKLAPMLISGWFCKSFTFMLLALHDGTTAQL